VRLPIAVAVILLSLVAGADATGARHFEYLHIEANSGGSSGGHAAIRIGEHCYHFQQGEDGTIQLRKDAAVQFEHTYRVLGNRTIHSTSVRVSDETLEQLRAAFEDYHRIQTSQFEVLDSLRDDVALFESLLAACRS